MAITAITGVISAGPAAITMAGGITTAIAIIGKTRAAPCLSGASHSALRALVRTPASARRAPETFSSRRD
jgi:hypothetical protein